MWWEIDPQVLSNSYNQQKQRGGQTFHRTLIYLGWWSAHHRREAYSDRTEKLLRTCLFENYDHDTSTRLLALAYNLSRRQLVTSLVWRRWLQRKICGIRASDRVTLKLTVWWAWRWINKTWRQCVTIVPFYRASWQLWDQSRHGEPKQELTHQWCSIRRCLQRWADGGVDKGALYLNMMCKIWTDLQCLPVQERALV